MMSFTNRGAFWGVVQGVTATAGYYLYIHEGIGEVVVVFLILFFLSSYCILRNKQKERTLQSIHVVYNHVLKYMTVFLAEQGLVEQFNETLADGLQIKKVKPDDDNHE